MHSDSSLSLFHRILVFIEDQDHASIEDLRYVGSSRQMLGALGRLEGLRYIIRKKENDQETLTLTEKGDTELANILDILSYRREPWDHKWRIILFDVPESRRTIRQQYRLKLIDLGARMLQTSVWLTPYSQVAEKFMDSVDHNAQQESVHIFEAEHIGITNINVTELWRLNDLEKEYKSMFTTFDDRLKQLKKNSHPSYNAKCMILELALLAKRDPRLPPEVMPKGWIGSDLTKWYEKIRPYCQ